MSMTDPEKTPAEEAAEPREETADAGADVDLLRKELEEAKGDRLRAMAELENVKRRLTREAEEFRKYASESVLSDLLPVIDNLDLALAHGQGLDACKNFVTGVEMTRKIFLDILKSHGLEPIGDIDSEFDPQMHEAVGFEGSQEIGEGRVCRLVQRGYMLKGRLVRPAKVLLSKPC